MTTTEEKYVDETINSNDVVVWSKSYCPYCKKVKELFKKLNVEYHAIELDQKDNGASIQAILKTKTGQSSVPNVFIKKQHIGGCDDTHAKEKDGSLQKLLGIGENCENKPKEKEFTMEEVGKHTTDEDLWVALHGKVYNVTAFLDEHPGGPEIIKENAGKDVTEEFEEVYHTDSARKLLVDMFVGNVLGYVHTESKPKGDGNNNIMLAIGVVVIGIAAYAIKTYTAQ